MSGEEREGRLGVAHVAILNIHAFGNESTHAKSCGVTRGFLRNSCDGSSNSKQVLILRGKRPPEHLSFSASDGLSLSPSAEVSRQSGNPPRSEYARRIVLSKRAATLWSASSGGPAASGAARAQATNGSQTRGGRGAVAGLRRYRNLPYAKSTVAPTVHEGLKPSTSIRGGAA